MPSVINESDSNKIDHEKLVLCNLKEEKVKSRIRILNFEMQSLR